MPWNSLDASALSYFIRHTAAASWQASGSGYSVNIEEWSRLTGQTREDAAGDGWINAVHPDDVARTAAAWQTAVAHGTPYNTDYRLRCADGIYRWFNVRGVQLLSPEGHAGDWVGVILAIPTHRHQASTANGHAAAARAITPGALRAARAMLGMSAEQLADASGVSRSTVRRIEDDQGGVRSRATSVAPILAYLRAQGLVLITTAQTVIGVAEPAAPADQAVAESGGGPSGGTP